MNIITNTNMLNDPISNQDGGLDDGGLDGGLDGDLEGGELGSG